MIQTVENIGEKLVSMLTYDASQPLIFSSGLFLFLFAGFLFFYGFTRRAPMARIVYVILFSLYFYYKSSGIYFLLLVFASVSDYWIAHAIYKVRTQRAKYWLVGLSVLVNLGMLGYFKYTNFLIEIANNLFGQGFLNFQNIFLPVGISFFVFQSMSYTIDICRGQLKPLNNWADYLFYLSFFPQLVAGPIVRAKDFIPQIRQNPLRVTREMFGMGVFLILIGLFKKAVISDYISLNFVDRIFDEPLLYSGFECLMGIYGYALQIYCDFSGYSDMAIGIALLLGFRFPKNFDAPYKSATITEFWRRWHISLSTWLRDYLYISLGGNRKGRIRLFQPARHHAARRSMARGGRALHPLGSAARHSAGPAQALAERRSRLQSHRSRNAVVLAYSGHFLHLQSGLLRMADVPCRIDENRAADAPPNFHELQSFGHPPGARRLCRHLPARRHRLPAAHASRPLRPLGATIRHLPTDDRTGSPGRVRHLAGDAGQVERYPAFHLLPILNDLCTPATNPCFWLSISTAVPAWTGS